MAEQVFFLDDQSRRILQKMLDEHHRTRGLGITQETFGDPGPAPELHVAVPPCGVGIPKRSGDVPGQTECCIFKLVQGEDDSFSLKAVTDEDGKPLRRPVLNIYDVAVPALMPPDERYIVIYRDKFGRWLCEYPSQQGTGTGTTTTSTSTARVDGNCVDVGGRCQWSWSQGSYSWSKVGEAPCGTTTTTTTTTTTSSTTTGSPDPTTTSSTTTPYCLCPSDGPSGTTTTTSTTTEQVCDCLYPTFCGSEDGECAFTDCSNRRNDPPKCEPTSTSTTSTTSSTSPGETSTSTPPGPCDCRTTSTATPDPRNPFATCLMGCQWTMTRFGWYLTYSDCSANCPCEKPADDAEVGDCATMSTPCVPKPPPQPPPQAPDCGGHCSWYWFPGALGWTLIDENCTRNARCANCGCSPPSTPGSDCAFATTACGCPYNPTTTSSTTTGVCDYCYTTSTSSTSSTTAPCDGDCTWKANGTGWTQISGDCPGSCPCAAPEREPTEPCEVAGTYCGEAPPDNTTSTTTSTSTSTTTTTTTTTTSTTTTTTTTTSTTTPGFPCAAEGETPCGYWCDPAYNLWSSVPASSVCEDGETCDWPYGGSPPFGECDPETAEHYCYECQTTTTTTTANPCNEVCVYYWSGAIWSLFNNFCSPGCECTIPNAPGPSVGLHNWPCKPIGS